MTWNLHIVDFKHSMKKYPNALQEETAAANALKAIIPVNGSIIHHFMMTTLYERLAYIAEVSATSKGLLKYNWGIGQWHRISMYEAVHPCCVEIKSYCANIIDIFRECGKDNNTMIIVEETAYMKWWHMYLWNSGTWKYSMSHQKLICRTAELR